MKIVKVIVPFPLNNSFDYITDFDVTVGNLVNITFSRMKTVGLVIDVYENENNIESNFKLKKIESIVDIKTFSKELIDFIKWVSEYNLIPIGMVFKFIFSEKFLIKNNNVVSLYYLNNNNLDNKITQKQENIVNFLKNNNDKSYVFDELKNYCSLNILKTLVKNNIILTKKEEFKKYDFNITDIKLNKLSIEQDLIFNKIINFTQNEKKPILLEGATGSGKTEIYFHLFKNFLDLNEDNQMLFLLPEIALTTQFIDRIKKQFICKNVAVWHSNISDSDKKNIWNDILSGSIKILIGARSSLFLPFNNLSLIVVDEEHDSSYKQTENGCYNARDMAIVRSKIENCPIILGSATPSLETLINVDNLKYNYVYLKDRFGKSTVPLVDIIDLKKEKIASNKYLSNKLLNEIKIELDKKNQVLLFMNKRGYSPIALCKECGYKFVCKNCSSNLTVYKKNNLFTCNQCGYKMQETNNCPDCGTKDSIIFFGPGVEKIEKEVKEYFPDKNSIVITSDTVQNIKEIKNIVDKISNNEIDIIIGTQMITKGYDFPKITLVGVLDADASLFGANFRAVEKTYQLLTQVIGRSGRRDLVGKALIQSYNSDNIIMQALKKNDKEVIINFEKENRKLIELPPYGKLALISLSGKKEIDVYRKIKEIRELFPYDEKVDIYGPTQSNIYKIKNNFRFRLLIKTNICVNIQKLIVNVLNGVKIDKSLKIKIDINPYFIE